jgi:ABC-type dipeptide/oligopeptide/nickel transport system permease component
MSSFSYWYLALLVVFVLIGIAGGIALALAINQWTHNTVFAFGQGIGTILVTFGCCSLGVVLMYLLAVQVEKLVRGRRREAKAKAKETRPRKKKHRKKQF